METGSTQIKTREDNLFNDGAILNPITHHVPPPRPVTEQRKDKERYWGAVTEPVFSIHDNAHQWFYICRSRVQTHQGL